MNANVFFFSGTGNSFAVARDIAQALEARLIPIGSVLDQVTVETGAAVIGVVFPHYYGSNDLEVPLAVRSFLSRLRPTEDAYIFAVCTYGGGVGTVFAKVDAILEKNGRRLSAGYGIHMPQNAFRKPWEKIPGLLEGWDRRKGQVCSDIARRRVGHFDRDRLRFRLLARVMGMFVDFQQAEKRATAERAHLSEDLPFEKLIPFVDSSYEVDDTCTGCGTCEEVCPVRNVKLVEGRPSWQHLCENCLACYNWCPQEAIQGGITQGYRYHHPGVRAADLTIRSRT